MAETGDHEFQPQPSSCAQFLLFDISGFSCGLPLREVREIVPICEMVRPPGLPAVLEGFLNLRGELVPSIRIDRLFGLTAMQFELHTHIVVLRRRPPLALLADRVGEIIAREAGVRLEEPAESVFGDCVEATLRLTDRDVSLLRLDRLLLKEEESRIEEFLRIAERRLSEIGALSP